MPWKECHVMDERLRFVARLLDGEKMAPLCAEIGKSWSGREDSNLRPLGPEPSRNLQNYARKTAISDPA